MQRLVIIWQRFGPYHLARLRGAKAVLQPIGWEVIGLEVAGADHYAWDHAEDSQVERLTLFPSAPYDSISQSVLWRSVQQALGRVNATAVAINGWAVPEALAALHWCRANRRLSILMSETHRPSGVWWKEWLKRRRISRFGAALVGGGWHADYLTSLGFPQQQIFLGYDVVDNAHFSPGAHSREPEPAALRSRYGLPTRYFFANTRFIARKNIDGLLRAYAGYMKQSLSAGASPWDLVISGSGEMDQQWKALASELKVANHVHWPGFLQYQDLPAYYRCASAFVHPAHEEPWGLVVNEAAAAALPLIISNRVGATCELVRDHVNGYLVEPRDMASIEIALTRMAALSEEERRAFSNASRAIISNFGPARFGESLGEALKPASPRIHP